LGQSEHFLWHFGHFAPFWEFWVIFHNLLLILLAFLRNFWLFQANLGHFFAFGEPMEALWGTSF
jgi:hypothetical protein